MASTVKIKPHHLEKIIDITQIITDWKKHALKPKSWETFEQNWLPSLIQQIADNEFKVNRLSSSTPTWLIDQIYHCRKLSDGVDPKHALPLEDTLIGKEAIAICRAMSKGQIHYNQWATNSEFNNLFS